MASTRWHGGLGGGGLEAAAMDLHLGGDATGHMPDSDLPEFYLMVADLPICLHLQLMPQFVPSPGGINWELG